MPSPFPGMNPYLEQAHLWEDFHQSLSIEIRDQLAPAIEPRYFAALNVQMTYQEVLLAEMPVKEFTVEIRETEYGKLVTSIEILSPVNKQPGHQSYRDYLEKRRALPLGGVSLLEIDLLRTGRRVVPPFVELPDAPYFVFLTRGNSPSRLEIWPIGLREPIPVVPVPLRNADPDVPLDLSHAIQAIYDRARYRFRIDYRRAPPRPEFSADDQAWIEHTTSDNEQRSE